MKVVVFSNRLTVYSDGDRFFTVVNYEGKEMIIGMRSTVGAVALRDSDEVVEAVRKAINAAELKAFSDPSSTELTASVSVLLAACSAYEKILES